MSDVAAFTEKKNCAIVSFSYLQNFWFAIKKGLKTFNENWL